MTYSIHLLNLAVQITEIRFDKSELNFLLGSSPSHDAEEKKNVDFHDDFHDAKNPRETDPIQLPTLEAS